MRTSILVASVALLLAGCEADSVTAPAPASVDAPVASGLAAPRAGPSIFACRVGSTSAEPLFVVDGTIAPFETVRELDPDAIGSIEVVKGTAASDVYGSRASAGVVLITTRAAEARALRARRSRRDGPPAASPPDGQRTSTGQADGGRRE